VIIVDEHHKPLERHEHGEIVVRGPAVMAGHCRKQLAAYKCPTEIRVVPDLPKTITGKIRRNALRDDIRSH
jgi:acyl-CoA synthetase (AMP-forming)/AMP-acid ligase II